MYRLLLLVAVAACCASVAFAACPAQGVYRAGDNQAQMQVGSRQRQFIVYVPNSYDNSKPVAVQFLFHGLNDNCQNFIDATGFKQFAEEDSRILVAPCGTNGLMGTAWNSGTCCGFMNEEHPNDFDFAKMMVANVSSELCVDSNRVFSSGFSNGAMMSEVLGCRESELFRGVASVSGIVELRPGNSGGLEACSQSLAKSSRRPSVLNIHGNLDFLVPWTGDAILGFPTVPDDMNNWVKSNNCSSTPKQTFNRGAFSNQVWDGCASSGTVELVKNQGGGHEWPSTSDFDTTTYINDWIKKQQ